jgi:DnaJ-class molecular chaperone
MSVKFPNFSETVAAVEETAVSLEQPECQHCEGAGEHVVLGSRNTWPSACPVCSGKGYISSKRS